MILQEVPTLLRRTAAQRTCWAAMPVLLWGLFDVGANDAEHISHGCTNANPSITTYTDV